MLENHHHDCRMKEVGQASSWHLLVIEFTFKVKQRLVTTFPELGSGVFWLTYRCDFIDQELRALKKSKKIFVNKKNPLTDQPTRMQLFFVANFTFFTSMHWQQRKRSSQQVNATGQRNTQYSFLKIKIFIKKEKNPLDLFFVAIWM